MFFLENDPYGKIFKILFRKFTWRHQLTLFLFTVTWPLLVHWTDIKVSALGSRVGCTLARKERKNMASLNSRCQKNVCALF